MSNSFQPFVAYKSHDVFIPYLNIDNFAYSAAQQTNDKNKDAWTAELHEAYLKGKAEAQAEFSVLHMQAAEEIIIFLKQAMKQIEMDQEYIAQSLMQNMGQLAQDLHLEIKDDEVSIFNRIRNLIEQIAPHSIVSIVLPESTRFLWEKITQETNVKVLPGNDMKLGDIFIFYENGCLEDRSVDRIKLFKEYFDEKS